MGPVHSYFLLLLLAISVVGTMAVNSPCGKIFNSTDSITPDDIPKTATNCTFKFSINSTTDTLMLVFSSLAIESSITIFAELPSKSEMITNITSGTDPVTVVSTSALTTVTFQRPSSSQDTFKIINKNGCEQDVDQLSGFLSSPKYLPFTNKTIVCKYNVMSSQDRLTLLAFTSFSLKSGNLTVDGTDVSVVSGKKLPYDQLVPSNTSMVLTIPNTEKSVEEFTLIPSFVNKDCSTSAFNVSGSFTYTSSAGGTCHLMINGSSGSLVAAVKSWKTLSSDRLQFQDGFSQEDKSLTSGNLVQAGFTLVSTGSLMSVHMEFGHTSQERNVEISFTSQAYGKLVEVGTNITYDSAKPESKEEVFQCTLNAAKKVSLTNFNMMNNGKVEVYDGNIILGNPIFTFTNTSLSIPVFMKSNQMTIVAKKTTSNYSFSAIAGEARDCDQFSQPGLGSYAVNALGSNDTYTYNLIILPLFKEVFRGTLQLTSLSLCPGDKVTIFEGVTTVNAQKQLVEFTYNATYPFIPQFIFGADKGARVMTALSKCDKRQAGDVVLTASYDMKTLGSLCGEKPSSPSGSVMSPSYPLRYPLNLDCQWLFENKTNSFLYVSVVKLNISDGNSLKLTGDVTEFNFTADKTVGRDLIFSKSKDLMLTFSSVPNVQTFVIPGEGFMINYDYLDCGGSSTKNINVSLGGVNKDCRWIISLPPKVDTVISAKSVYIINATFSVTAGFVAGSLIVFDGTSMKEEHKVNLTNLTDTHELSFQSRLDTFIIQYLNNNATAKTFSLAVKIVEQICTTFCQNGICMHKDWECNGINDCGDNSDELFSRCNETIPVPITTQSPNTTTQSTQSPPPPKPTPEPCKGEVPGFWLAIMLIIGLIVGILLPFIVPAIFRRMRKRNYNRMTDMGNPEA